MYFIRIESCIIWDLSHCTNTLLVLKSSFLPVLFCFVVGITAVLKAAEQEKEIIVIDQAFGV